MVANESAHAHRFVANEIVNSAGRRVRAGAPGKSGRALQVRAGRNVRASGRGLQVRAALGGRALQVRAGAPSESERARRVRAWAGAK